MALAAKTRGAAPAAMGVNVGEARFVGVAWGRGGRGRQAQPPPTPLKQPPATKSDGPSTCVDRLAFVDGPLGARALSGGRHQDRELGQPEVERRLKAESLGPVGSRQTARARGVSVLG